ncbi:MAG: hypothetical protein MUF34_25210 [Polyangiaceae bacterium]|nr:hypothetical protein [Polyangiaceae bacterium]
MPICALSLSTLARPIAKGTQARALVGALACALAAGACTETGEKNSGTTAPSASVAAPPAVSVAATASAPAPAPSALPLGQRLACEKMLPEAGRARLLPGFALRQGAKCPECGPECTLTHPSKPFEGVQVAYVCNEGYDAKKAKALTDPLRTSLRKSGTVKLGRGGVHGEKDFGTFYSVLAFDDDSDCRVSLDWMRGDREKALGLAKLALEGVKQADLR